MREKAHQARRAVWDDASSPRTAALPGIPGDAPFRRDLFPTAAADGREAARSLFAHVCLPLRLPEATPAGAVFGSLGLFEDRP